ncbi:MAG: hypothetical protein RLY43_604 [Bacteroidota bacterium]|jgi:hypothetical protein
MQIPDLKKPRVTECKGKVIEYAEFKQFKKLHPEYKNITINDLIKIARTFNKNMVAETMVNPYGVVLPENIGVICINNAGKSTKKMVDYQKSKELGVTVHHKNWETDGHIMRIMYSSIPVRNVIKNNNLFSFTPILEFKRAASKYFKKNWQRCVRLNYTIK